jgi:hypothetical protein
VLNPGWVHFSTCHVPNLAWQQLVTWHVTNKTKLSNVRNHMSDHQIRIAFDRGTNQHPREHTCFIVPNESAQEAMDQ